MLTVLETHINQAGLADMVASAEAITGTGCSENFALIKKKDFLAGPF